MTDLIKIEKLLEKYLDAETTLQEEALLKHYFNSDKVAAHLMPYQSMFVYFSTNKAESYSKNLRLKSKNTRRNWFTGIAAGIALMMGGFAYNNYLQQKQAEQALADTKMAMELIAKQLNKADKAVDELENVEKTKEKAAKTIQLSFAH